MWILFRVREEDAKKILELEKKLATQQENEKKRDKENLRFVKVAVVNTHFVFLLHHFLLFAIQKRMGKIEFGIEISYHL